MVRRIKMLEYSLKQERAKLQRLKGELKPEQQTEDEDPHITGFKIYYFLYDKVMLYA